MEIPSGRDDVEGDRRESSISEEDGSRHILLFDAYSDNKMCHFNSTPSTWTSLI